VDAALALEPGHLSAYCFIPEPGTPLGAAVLRDEQALPRPDEQAECYEALARWTGPRGYAAYETSNFCRPGEEARHNLVYWLRRPYLGLGPSAHGLVGGVRYGNHYALERWAGALEAGAPCEAEREEENDRTLALEVVMLGLRLSDGIDRRDYDARTWRVVERRYGAALDLALAAGRLEPTAHGVRIPGRFAFVADDVIAWIEARADRARRAPDPAARGLTVAASAP
jgi:coproporphyrinogen III oxidase-like Fe-S oxidoreductase